MSAPERADVCIVGAGASGATAAHVLTRRGARVVILDRGPWLQPQDFVLDELATQSREYLLPDPRTAPKTFRESEERPAEPVGRLDVPMMIGGGTVHWGGGHLMRLTPDDFRQHTIHGDVAGASLADWPITYADLEPYYCEVEWGLGVSGRASGSPFDGPRSRDYPCPPFPEAAYARVFQRGCDALGLGSYPTPVAKLSRPHAGRPASVLNGTFGSSGDPTNTHSNVVNTFIAAALATGRLEVRSGSYVGGLVRGADGRIAAAEYVDDDGAWHRQEAAAFVLACGAIESARLWLLSDLPDGSGQVGRNFTAHGGFRAVGFFDEPLDSWSAWGHLSRSTMGLYGSDPSRGFINGCWFNGLPDATYPITYGPPERALWGAAAKQADRRYFNHLLSAAGVLNDLPQPGNRVTLDPTVVDAWGLPAARVTRGLHPNDRAMLAWASQQGIDILRAAGAKDAWASGKIDRTAAGSTHQHGTLRMGTDGSHAVVRPDGSAFEVSNLYAIDGAIWPTAGAVSPSLTIMANAWRIAERLATDGPRARAVPAAARAPLPPPKAATLEPFAFTPRERAVLIAAMDRVIPGDDGPGATEAGVIGFLDRYLGEGMVLASSSGGSRVLAARDRARWNARIERLRALYRDGAADLDARARVAGGAGFTELDDAGRDAILASLAVKAPQALPRVDDRLDFFTTLALHTRQGFFADPAYGGNRDGAGWRSIGFPGPAALDGSKARPYP